MLKLQINIILDEPDLYIIIINYNYFILNILMLIIVNNIVIKSVKLLCKKINSPEYIGQIVPIN